MRRALATLALAALMAGHGGCTTVKPWQRSTLMRRAMRPVLNPLERSFEVHMHRIRGQMAGASGSAGASCGCN